MRISWITIHVKDLETSRQFYEGTLGLQKTREFSPEPGMTIVFYATEGEMQIELIANAGSVQNRAAKSNVSIGIVSKRYDSILEAARSSGYLVRNPVVFAGNMECYFITDPDGVSLQIIKDS